MADTNTTKPASPPHIEDREMIKTTYTTSMTTAAAEGLAKELQGAIFASNWAVILLDSHKPKFTDDMPYATFIEQSDRNAALVKKIKAAARAMEKLASELLDAQISAE
jgi:uncharacterized protein with von Willebrand factor type A (vWA) domain